MPYRLREGLSYCQVDNCLIFLDIEEDSYFRLSKRLENMFFAYLRGVDPLGANVDELVRRRILTVCTEAERPSSESTSIAPSRSALERQLPAPGLHAAALPEIFLIVCSTQFQLKTRRLRHILASLAAYRQRRTACSRPNSTAQSEGTLLDSTTSFRRLRPYVPIETCCLLDSLAMVRFLARRRLFARIVIGVTHNPFAAHCWVQAGDWVLNDTVGNVAAHIPIREI